MLVGIVAYFAKKDFNRIEKELKQKRDKETCDIIHKVEDEKTVRRINELGAKLAKDFFSDLGLKGSPYHPSEEGAKLLRDSGWNNIYKEIKEDIFSWIDEENHSTLYDVEKAAFYVLDKNKDDKRFNCLKDYIMNNPEKDLSAIFLVASWIIRDEYWNLKRNKKNL